MDPRAGPIAVCTVGIVGSLMLYGVLQERIMTQPCVPRSLPPLLLPPPPPPPPPRPSSGSTEPGRS